MKVAAIQLNSTPAVSHNLQQAAHWIAEAAAQGAQLIVLPEMFAIFGATPDATLAQQEPMGNGPLQNFLSQQAQQHQVWLVGGTIPLASQQPNKVAAACLVYDPAGQCRQRYDKIHLYDATLTPTETYQESALFTPGEHVVTCQTPFATLGLAVCYDLRFPELFRQLSSQHAEVFCLPAAFTVKTGEAHWELLARARAVENFCFVIGAAQGGQHSATRHTWGHSLIIGPWGDVLASKADTLPGVVVADLDVADLHRARHMLPALKHRRL